MKTTPRSRSTPAAPRSARCAWSAVLSRFLLSACRMAVLGLLALAPGAQAATVTWGTATTISADTDVATSGLRLYAYCWGTAATVNGVPFTQTTSGTGAGTDVTLASFGTRDGAAFGASGTPYNNLTANYQSIIKGGAYGGTAAGTVTLNKLVSGRSYTVQIWVHDGRSGLTPVRWDDIGGGPRLLYYNGGTVTSPAGGVGQYATGTFTADATTQAITLTPGFLAGSGSSASVQINAIQVRDTTAGSADGAWNTSGSGLNWSTAANWLGSTIANDPVATADFSKVNITTDPTVVNLDSSRTIGNLIFGDTVTNSAAGWSLTGSTLTLSAATPTITVNTLGASKFAQVSSILAGSFGLSKAGAGELRLVPASVETFTGGLAVNQGQLTVNWGSTLSTANLINLANALTLGGGTISLQANSGQSGQSQTFAGTTLNAGANVVGLNAGSGTTFPVVLGAVTRNAGSTLNISLTHAGTKNISSSSWTSGNPILDSGVAYATLYASTTSTGNPPAGGDDWAQWNGTTAVAASPTPSTTSTLTGNASVATGINTTLTANSTPNSVRFSLAEARTITINSTFSLTTGGILVGSGVGNNLSTITGAGTLKSAATVANKDLVIINNDTSSGLTISAIIANATAGATALTKSGAGLLTLSGVNTYSGPTYINSGTVSINSEGAASAGGSLGITPASATPGKIVLNGGTLSLSAAITINANRGMTLGANGGTLLNAFNGQATYAGIIAGSGGLTINNTGGTGGLWVFGNASSTYTGGTTLTSSSGAIVLNTSSTGSAGNPASGPFGAGTAPLNLAGGQIRASTSGGPYTVANPVVISADTTFATPGSGTAANLTFSGPVTLTGTSPRTLTGSSTAGTITLSGVIGEASAGIGLTKAGANTVILSGANTYTGPTTISAGTLQLGSGSASGSLSPSSSIANSGTLAFNRSDDIVQGTHFANGITGSGTLSKSGGGKLTLNTANSFSTSASSLGGGTLTLANAGAMGVAGVPINFVANTTSTLELATDSPVNAYVLTSSSGASTVGNVVLNRATAGAAVDQNLGITGFGVSTINFSKGANVSSGTPTVNFTALGLTAGQAGTTTLAPTTANVAFSGAATASGTANLKTLALDGTSTGNSIAGGITDGTATPLSLTKANSSTWTISGANTYNGNTTISGGTLALGAGGTIPNSPTISVASGATFDVTTPGFTVGTLQTLANAGTVNGNLTINGTMNGSGAAGGAITVNGVLTGTGTAGTVTVTSGGKLTPGTTGIGTLTASSLTLASGSTLDYEFTDGTGIPNDMVNVTTSGGLTLNGGAINLYVSGGTSAFTVNGTYNLFQYSGSLGGTGISALSVANAQTGKTYAFSTDGTYVQVTIADAPVAVYWNKDNDDTWAADASWTGTFPNVPSAIANFGGGGTPITAPRTVTLDDNKTVGSMAFDSANSFTINPGTPSGVLTLDNGSGAAAINQITGSHTLNAPLALTSAGAGLTAATSTTLAVNGAVSGSGALTKSGAGTVVLGADNGAYSGNTTISAGTLQVGAGSAAGSLGSGSVNNSGALVFNRSDAALIAANNIGGAGTAANNGNGTVTLSGASTYTGATLLNSGILSIGSIADTGSSPVGISTAGGLTFNGGTLQFTSTSGATNTARIVTLTGAGTIDVPSGAGLSLNGGNATPSATVATWSGSGGLTKTGLGTLTLGANTNLNGRFAMGQGHGGTLTVNDGVLNIKPIQYWTLGQDASTTAAYVQNGGIVTYTPTTASSVYNADAAGTTASMTINNGSLSLGANALYVGNNGAGTLNLGNGSGSTATLSAGKLQKGSGTANANFNGGKIIATAASTSFMTGLSAATVNDYGVTIDDGGFAITVGQALLAGTGAGGLTKLGTNVLTLASGANTYGGNTAINAGYLSITGTGSLPGWDTAGRYSVAVNAGLAVYNAVTDDNITTLLGTGNFQAHALLGFDTTTANRTYPAVTGTVADNGANALGLAKLGGNTLILSGANSYSGNTYIDAGSLQLNHNSALGNSASITMSGLSSSALLLGNGIVAGSGKTLTIKGSGVGTFYGALSTASGNTGTSEWQGNVVVGATASRVGSQAGSLKISGNITDGGNNYQLVVRNNGSLVTILSGNNSYGGNAVGGSGGTSIAFGELQVSGGTAIPDNGTVYLATTAANVPTFRVVGSETVASLSGGSSGAMVSIEASQTLTLAYGANSYAGVLSGSGTLTVNGASQTLTAASPAFTGNTLISSGTLTLGTGGSLAASPVISVASGATFDVSAVGHTVNNSKTLTGAGSVVGTVTVASGGKVIPGSSVGTLTLSALTLSSGSTLDFELVAPENNDLVNVTTSGGLTLSGGAINLYQVGSTAAFADNGTYKLFQYAGAIGGTGIGALSVANAQFGKRYTFGTSSGYVTLTIADTPITYWAVDSDGDWGTGANWSSAAEPNVAGEIANFGGYSGTTFTGPHNIALGSVGSTTKTVGSVIFDNAQAFTLNAAGGSLALDNGSGAALVTVNQGSHAIAAPLSLTAAGVNFSLATSAALSLGGAMSGSGPLNKTGNGTLTLSTANSYSGGTTVSAGTVQVSGSGTLGATTAPLNANGGTLDLGATTQTAGTVTIAGGTIANGTLTGTSYAGQSGTVSAVLAGASIALTKTIAGTLTLSGANTYGGLTSISAGTLQNGSATTFTAKGALALTGNSVFDLNGFNASVTDISSSANTATITDNSSGSGTSILTLSAQSSANSALVKDGSAKKVAVYVSNNNGGTPALSLSSANTFSGGVTLLNTGNGTRLTINTAITGTPFGTGAITIGQATTDKAGVFVSSANITLANAVTFNTSAGTDRYGLRLDTTGNTLSGLITANLADATFSANAAASATLTGQITGSKGLILDVSQSTSTAGLTLTLNNPSAITPNDYLGDTVINRTGKASTPATLTLGRADQIPNGAGKGNVTINSSVGTGTLNLAGFSETINGLNGNGTLDGVTGSPVLTLGDGDANANTFSGIIKNTAGTLSLTKIGTGTQTLSGINTYSGATLISAGTLSIGNANALGATTAGTTVSAGAALDFNATVTLAAEPITINGTGINSAGAIHVGGNKTAGVSGLITLGSDARIKGDGGTTFNATGGIDLSTHTLTFAGDGGSFANVDTGAIIGTGGLIKSGNIALTLSGVNTFSGDTLVQGGTLTLANNLALQNSAFDTAGAGTLSLNPAVTTPTFGGLKGSTALTLPTTVTALTLNPGVSQSPSYAGPLDGGSSHAMTLTKTGLGTQTLSGANLYSGATTISGGTLSLGSSGSISNTPTITVASGALFDVTNLTAGAFVLLTNQILKGNGTVRGNVIVDGTLAAGASIGVLTDLGNVTWAPGGTNEVEIGGSGSTPGSDCDFLSIGGELHITVTNGAPAVNKFTLKLVASGAIPSFGNASNFWPIATATNGVFGFNAGDLGKFNLDLTGFTNNNPLGSGTLSLVLLDSTVAVLYSPGAAPCSYTTTNWFGLQIVTNGVSPNFTYTTNMLMTFSNASYLTSVQALTLSNCTLTGKAYANGDANATDVTSINLTSRTALPENTVKLVLTAVKTNQTMSAAVNALVIDSCGRGKSFDPVITTLTITSGNRVTQRFEGLLSAEHYLRVLNATPGLKWLEINLNGRVFRLDPLADGQDVSADLWSAMHEGDNNVVILTGGGDVGASAFVTITDTASGNLVALPEIVTLGMSQTTDGLVLSWPDTLAGWELQGSASAGAGWSAVASTPLSANGQFTVNVPATSGTQFYRLAGSAPAPAAANGTAPTASENSARIAGPTDQTSASNRLTYEGILW